MNIKSGTLRTITGVFFLLIWVVLTIIILNNPNLILGSISQLDSIVLIGLGLMLCFILIDCRIDRIEWREINNEAWKEIRKHYKENIGEYQEVYYLFPERSSNEEYKQLAYMAKCKNYIFRAKLIEDNKIYLSCVDEKGNEIEHREIVNPVFFNHHFSFTKKE